MFRIRRVYNTVLPVNQRAMGQVQEILREQFPALREEKIASLPEQLQNPLKYRFHSILFIAEDISGNVRGFALLCHAPDLKFCLLDFIATRKKPIGRGVGGALYERIREEAVQLKVEGLFLECLPDDPKLCSDPTILKQNRARLRFYEQYGAFPIINTCYEVPVQPEDDNPPYLIFDSLGLRKSLRRDSARTIVKALLERKYADICPSSYIEMVVNSFRDDPVRIRPPRYIRHIEKQRVSEATPYDKKIELIVNEGHTIHHVKERGYVETPVRVPNIMKDLGKTDLFKRKAPDHFSESWIRRVHENQFVDYFKKVCSIIDAHKSVYPYVFPIRNAARPPKELAVRAGYFCIDTFTPLNRNAYLAARGAVDCGLTGAKSLTEGTLLSYALVRPPGHHAERRSFGGFCYFNTSAIAAEYLSGFGRVAILDIDYHHGNGQQQIFYGRSDVLTLSIHGHPSFAYPYFSGFKSEIGDDTARGYNQNYPLPEQVERTAYIEVLKQALHRLSRFRPAFVVVALGLDTARGDPTGTWNLMPADFKQNGYLIGKLGIPVLVVQEGGYNIRRLGINARHFFEGLWQGMYKGSA